MYKVSQDEVPDKAILALKESDAQLVNSDNSIDYELRSSAAPRYGNGRCCSLL